VKDEADELVDALVRRGRAAWPEVAIPAPIIAAHFAAKLGQHAGASLHAEDLYLACACALGVEPALVAFDERYLSQVKVFLGRMKPTPTLIDDVQQALRVRLLVAREGAVPRIAEYGGRGSLTSWVRVAAIRLALDALAEAGATRPLPDEDGAPLFDQLRGDDPELELIKERYRDEVNAALRDAFAALSAEQRNLLRLSYRDGRSIDEIGALLGTPRATVARWIAGAREAVLDEARRSLETRLRLTPSELQSLVELLRSQLHLSISRLLGEDGAR
jgi:RNA polymerase sigma-70 factor (ECF subfamily)